MTIASEDAGSAWDRLVRRSRMRANSIILDVIEIIDLPNVENGQGGRSSQTRRSQEDVLRDRYNMMGECRPGAPLAGR